MKTINEFDEMLPDEESCKRLLTELRWPGGVTCPRCGNQKVYALKSRPFHWVCKSGLKASSPAGRIVICPKNGGYRFSVISGTVFQDTKIPLKLWFKVAYLMLTAKKGISALQIHRVIFGEDSTHDYRTSWYMCMRLRSAMRGKVIPPLEGEVEADETWIGGKDKNRHWKDRSHAAGGYGDRNKTMVIGAIARKGNVICQSVDELGFTTLNAFVSEAVSTRAKLIATDENPGYRHLKQRGYRHKSVNHSKHRYVVGTVHTQTIESFWSLIKRGVIGNYHHVSREYLPLYLNEFSFRFNNRKNPEMFEALLQGV